MASRSGWILAVAALAALPAAAQVTPSERTAMAAAHNAVREDAVPWPVPELPAIVWSATRESGAQTYANLCVFQHSPGALLGQYGENLYASTSSESPVPRPTPAAVVAAWGGEAADYDYASNSCAPFPAQCGHYTQIVLRPAALLGCGVALCGPATSPFPPPNNVFDWWIWVCQYDVEQTTARPYLCDYGAGSVVCDNRGIFRDGVESGSVGRWSAHT